MKKTKEIICEEQFFLQLCGVSYRHKIENREELTMNEFRKILFILTTLGLWEYMSYFILELYPRKTSELGDYLESRPKEHNFGDWLYAELDCQQRWLREFWEQMPLESQKEKYRSVFMIEID